MKTKQKDRNNCARKLNCVDSLHGDVSDVTSFVVAGGRNPYGYRLPFGVRPLNVCVRFGNAHVTFCEILVAVWQEVRHTDFLNSEFLDRRHPLFGVFVRDHILLLWCIGFKCSLPVDMVDVAGFSLRRPLDRW